MPMEKNHALFSYLVSGTAVGIFGVVLFGLAHALIIVPIWRQLFGGIPFCLAAGLALGWAYYEMQASNRMGAGFKSALGFGVLLWTALLPMTLFGVIVRATGIHGPNDGWETAVEVLLAFGAGAAAGQTIGGNRRAALAMGTAALALALAQGGPVPVLNSVRAAGLFAALAVIYPFSGLTFGFLRN